MKIPDTAYEAILKLRLQPNDDLTQVFKDALETHNRVVYALRNKGVLHIHHGAKVVPLNLDHLTTPEAKRKTFEIIIGGRDE